MNKRGLIVLFLALIGVAVFFKPANADQIRKQFFADSKKAVLFSKPGSTVNCCGVGDAVKVRIVGSSKNGLQAAMITDTMRHAFAGTGKIKVGTILTIRPTKIAKWPRVPVLFKSHIVFISGGGLIYCFMQKQAGG